MKVFMGYQCDNCKTNFDVDSRSLESKATYPDCQCRQLNKLNEKI